MTLRRLEILATEVREVTDTKDINSLGVYELMGYFNDGQKQIQKIIFTANPSTDIFTKSFKYTPADLVSGGYNLPFDIYAHNSVTALIPVSGDRLGKALDRISYAERGGEAGD